MRIEKLEAEENQHKANQFNQIEICKCAPTKSIENTNTNTNLKI